MSENRIQENGTSLLDESKRRPHDQLGQRWATSRFERKSYRLKPAGKRPRRKERNPAALKAWPGGRVIATHDRELLADIGITREIEM